MTTLIAATNNHLHALAGRLDRATGRTRERRLPGDSRAWTDDFLMASTQHLAALVDVVVPVLRRQVPDGRHAADDLLKAVRRLERSLVIAKAKQYGQAQNVRRQWEQVWARVGEDLRVMAALERETAALLTAALPAEAVSALGDRLIDVAQTAPTRPHPHLPHRGVAGRITRTVWSRADRVWDEFEGRTVHPL